MELSSKQFHKKIIEILLVLLPIALLFSNIVSEIIILILIAFYFLNQNLKNFFKNFTDPIILLFFTMIFWTIVGILYSNYSKLKMR